MGSFKVYILEVLVHDVHNTSTKFYKTFVGGFYVRSLVSLIDRRSKNVCCGLHREFRRWLNWVKRHDRVDPVKINNQVKMFHLHSQLERFQKVLSLDVF